MAYVMPMLSVVQEIQTAFPQSVIGLPSPFDLLADLAHYHFSSKEESKMENASKFADQSVSLPVLLASSDSPEDLAPRSADHILNAIVLRKAHDTEASLKPLLSGLIQRTGSNLRHVMKKPENWIKETGLVEFTSLLNVLKQISLECEAPASSGEQPIAERELPMISGVVDLIESPNNISKNAPPTAAGLEGNERQENSRDEQTPRQRRQARVQNMANARRPSLKDKRNSL
jgi:hypothetical protein